MVIDLAIITPSRLPLAFVSIMFGQTVQANIFPLKGTPNLIDTRATQCSLLYLTACFHAVVHEAIFRDVLAHDTQGWVVLWDYSIIG